jgi:mRNA interferase MazF
MARRVNRGEIWGYRFASSDKWRPVLVLSRQEVIGLLHTVMVAPITTIVRGAPSEVTVGVAEGLKKDSAINLDLKQARPEVISGAAIHARPAVYTTPFFVYTSHIRADR